MYFSVTAQISAARVGVVKKQEIHRRLRISSNKNVFHIKSLNNDMADIVHKGQKYTNKMFEGRLIVLNNFNAGRVCLDYSV